MSFLSPKERPCHYNVGFLSPSYSGPSQLCYSNKCCTKGISMCRYPYYPSKMSRLYFNTPPTCCSVSRYLYKV